MDINKNRVAIKKLAESVTTIKNVLDSKINDEIQQVKFSLDLTKTDDSLTGTSPMELNGEFS